MTAILLALIGGGLGSILTWFLYGGGIGEGISAPIARAVYATGKFSLFLSQFIADLLVDLADKLLTVLIAALVFRLLPQHFQDRFRPSSNSQTDTAGVQKVRRVSLRNKNLFMIASFILLIAITVSAVSLSLFRNAVIEDKSKTALGIANIASSAFDHECVEEYLALVHHLAVGSEKLLPGWAVADKELGGHDMDVGQHDNLCLCGNAADEEQQ